MEREKEKVKAKKGRGEKLVEEGGKRKEDQGRGGVMIRRVEK